MGPQIFKIPFVPMSRNARDRAHWRERDKELNDWTLLIPNCSKQLRQSEDGPKRLVEIVFRKSRGPLSDPDNLVARAKVPLDAIVNRKWLIDDSSKYLVLKVREEVTGKRGSTHIAITEVQPRVRSAPAPKPEPDASAEIAALEARLAELKGEAA